ncbi:nuclear transport factor 2 family protein [Aspergillus fischeri NRRL 181]|uniref:SnoaL-like domain-containing protein n=1 Tax=Neosartorya fischeri (strain ATCC 1020 / DSM 3700 / CBS 544.65 / FGSC A1164 / JCM 1740 / NRRL 181 / WB 181) TaxID=331117 RepID=A1DJY1_NEOFI|nr:conserved hypothetical protein [Aspergillus fischeri NRRL 181]EAW17020.1 conserved hypothetical protein [Aspergillus fischeri NRRL 181]KAG2019173.1 hypothetical protein GB937_005467 [Aspergillus fischeri]
MDLPSILPKLTPALGDREAISDAMYRCLWGFDTADAALFASSFAADCVFDLNGNVMHGLEEIKAKCFDPIAKLDTTHFLTNVRVNYVEGESNAVGTSCGLAQHYAPGQGLQDGSKSLLVGSLYWYEFIKDESDGLWKIKHWRIKSVWSEGDWSILQGN